MSPSPDAKSHITQINAWEPADSFCVLTADMYGNPYLYEIAVEIACLDGFWFARERSFPGATDTFPDQAIATSEEEAMRWVMHRCNMRCESPLAPEGSPVHEF